MRSSNCSATTTTLSHGKSGVNNMDMTNHVHWHVKVGRHVSMMPPAATNGLRLCTSIAASNLALVKLAPDAAVASAASRRSDTH
jgi:hypothetical protein